MRGKGLLAKAMAQLLILLFLLPFYAVAVVLRWLWAILKFPFVLGGKRKRRKITRGKRSQRKPKVLHRTEIEVKIPIDEAELDKQLRESGVIEKVVDEVVGRLDLPTPPQNRNKRFFPKV